MRPTFSSLVAARHGRLSVAIQGVAVPSPSGLANSRSAVMLSEVNGALTLGDGVGDPPGMWVHYHETRASYGVAQGGETWAASGPFSGCQIAIGKMNGQVFMAHLAQQSGSTADADWTAGLAASTELWGRWKVPVPSDTFFSNSIVFVDWSKGANIRDISVVRVDLKTKSMGGFDRVGMDIFNVVQVISPG